MMKETATQFKKNAKPFFLFAPFYLLSSKVDHIYQYAFKERLLGKQFQFMNFGYWIGHCSYDQASQHLALKLSDYANLLPHEKVLCVGCGYGDEVKYWQQHYHLQSCIGINLFFPHLPKKNDNIKNPFFFCQADAIKLPFANESFDKVLALESALHFNLREDFFKEALRVLKPQGTIALTDIITQDKTLTFVQKVRIVLAGIITKVPYKNQYNWKTYNQKLKEAGFEMIEVENLDKKVLSGFLHYLSKKTKKENKKLSFGFAAMVLLFGRHFPIRYIMTRARKG